MIDESDHDKKVNSLELVSRINLDNDSDVGVSVHEAYNDAILVFTKLDADGDGQLKRQEIRDYIDRHFKGKKKALQIAKMFDEMDADHDNRISRSKFVSKYEKFQHEADSEARAPGPAWPTLHNSTASPASPCGSATHSLASTPVPHSPATAHFVVTPPTTTPNSASPSNRPGALRRI